MAEGQQRISHHVSREAGAVQRALTEAFDQASERRPLQENSQEPRIGPYVTSLFRTEGFAVPGEPALHEQSQRRNKHGERKRERQELQEQIAQAGLAEIVSILTPLHQ